MNTCTASIPQGKLAGNDYGTYLEFLNVPYASDWGRFQEAWDAERWTGVRDATVPGPVFPQTKGRLSSVMGTTKEENFQSESAFSVNIWTPGLAGRRPVLFWMHGGAFMTGGGAIPWYGGAKLAAEAGIVVVNVSYRLGVLGNLYLPEVSEVNLSVKDVNRALVWVHENIEFFGGDPDNVTIAGQSAGAWYAVLMMGNPSLYGMYKRAGLFSFNGGTAPYTLEEGEHMAKLLLEKLQCSPQGLKDLPVSDILAAQKIAVSQPERLNIPFLPVIDSETIFPSYIRRAAEKADPDVEIFCGTVANESTPFVAYREGESEEAYLERVQANTDIAFENETTDLLLGLKAAGHAVYRYRFGFGSPMPHVHACHCFDIPFLLRNFDAWKGAPFLEGLDMQKAGAVSAAYSGAFVRFMETGDPGDGWSLWDGSENTVRTF